MGNPFEKEFRASLKACSETLKNFCYWRIYDTTSFRWASENIVGIKCPCDFIAGYNGRGYFFECKSSRSRSSYSFSYIKQHQIDSMFRAEKAGLKAWFLINNRSIPRKHTCYAIKPSTLKILIATHEARSIKWSLLAETPRVVELGRKGKIWDLPPIL